MRIVAGRFRRRQLLVNPGQTTRPITDRAKVILFDRIEAKCVGARVADIFSGTGSLGFEALSRGAKTAVFAEADHRAHSLLKQNAAQLGIEQAVVCWRVDVTRCSFRPKGGNWTPYTLVFFDPPYKAASDLAGETPLAKAMRRLSRADVTAPGCWLMVRVPKELSPVVPACWTPLQTREVASMGLYVFEKTAAGPEPTSEDDLEQDDESEEGPLAAAAATAAGGNETNVAPVSGGPAH